MKTINARDYPGPLSAFRAALDADPPVKLQLGNSGFTITPENAYAFQLGVLFATDEAWTTETKKG